MALLSAKQATTAKVVSLLKKKGKFAVSKKKDTITLHKTSNGRPCTIILEKQSNGKYHLLPATYEFKSAVARYDYEQVENRFCRNADLIFSVFEELRRKELIHLVSNTNSWVTLNPANVFYKSPKSKHSGKKEKAAELLRKSING